MNLWTDDAKTSDVWLFKQMDVNQPVTRAVATKWLAKAERLAELPKQRGGLWHTYRRLWATERKADSDVDVAKAGGWNGTKAMKMSYQQSTRAGQLSIIDRE